MKEKEMRTKKICTLLLAVSFLLMSGCAVGNKYTYNGLNLDIKSKGSAKIAVATHDQRSYIVSGNKKPNFVGLQRGGYGNPFNVTTASGNSLAEDITDTITRSLKSKGFNSIGVIVKHSDSEQAVKASLKRTNASRSIVTTLYEWKTDTYSNTSLKYDVRMQVLNADGNVIGEKKISGGDNLGGSAWDPPKHAKKAVPAAFVGKFEELLNSKEISGALVGTD
jgi:hypothetical protein